MKASQRNTGQIRYRCEEKQWQLFARIKEALESYLTEEALKQAWHQCNTQESGDLTAPTKRYKSTCWVDSTNKNTQVRAYGKHSTKDKCDLCALWQGVSSYKA
jgi:hypothetical protein